MRYAIISDIHSNLEALQTALDYLSSAKIDKYINLGDVVGYGADPKDCLKIAAELSETIICGNHDKAVFTPKLLSWFNPLAREAVEWTCGQLSEDEIGKLKDFPMKRIEDDFTLVHGSPNSPEEFKYLTMMREAGPAFHSFDNWICFVGHTHIPQVFIDKENITGYLEPGKFSLRRDERYIINCGSIGQPRDMDKRLSFGIFDDKENVLEIVRLEYDAKKAGEKIKKAGLPEYFADRLL